MFKFAILGSFFGFVLHGQNLLPIPMVRGDLQVDSTNGTTGGVVRLRSQLGHMETYEATLHADGTFQFPHVNPGSYTLTVESDAGESLAQESVDISSAATLHIRARGTLIPRRQAPAGTIPVSELRNPPSAKTLAVLAKARRATDAGDHAGAVKELTRAAAKNPSDGYLRTNLGIEYLRVGNLIAALPILQEAARLIPDSPKTRGNLAYAYYLGRRWDRAETEARASLAANHGDVRMRYLLGASLLASGSVEEGLANLRAVREAVPEARVQLANYYLRTGRKDAACEELRAYAVVATPAERAKTEKVLMQLTPFGDALGSQTLKFPKR